MTEKQLENNKVLSDIIAQVKAEQEAGNPSTKETNPQQGKFEKIASAFDVAPQDATTQNVIQATTAKPESETPEQRLEKQRKEYSESESQANLESKVEGQREHKTNLVRIGSMTGLETQDLKTGGEKFKAALAKRQAEADPGIKNQLLKLDEFLVDGAERATASVGRGILKADEWIEKTGYFGEGNVSDFISDALLDVTGKRKDDIKEKYEFQKKLFQEAGAPQWEIDELESKKTKELADSLTKVDKKRAKEVYSDLGIMALRLAETWIPGGGTVKAGGLTGLKGAIATHGLAGTGSAASFAGEEYLTALANGKTNEQAVDAALSVVPVGFASGALMEPVVMGAKWLGSGVKKLLPPSAKELPGKIKEVVMRGLQPTSTKKLKMHGGVKKYEDNLMAVMEDISRNRDSIEIINDEGVRVEKKIENYIQFGDAVEQRKKEYYKEYNDALLETQGAGAMFDPGTKFTTRKGDSLSAIEILEDMSTNKKFNHDVRSAAKDRLEKIKGDGPLTLEEAQERVKAYNESYDSYMYGRGGSKADAAIDVTLADAINRSLDEQIVSATGKEYRGLRKKFGALKEVEEDVQHRALHERKKADKNIVGRFSEVNAIRDLVGMGMSGWVGGAKAGATLLGSFADKVLTDKNRMLRQGFSYMDRLVKETDKLGTRELLEAATKDIPGYIPGGESVTLASMIDSLFGADEVADKARESINKRDDNK